jgi:hypothetical protein
VIDRPPHQTSTPPPRWKLSALRPLYKRHFIYQRKWAVPTPSDTTTVLKLNVVVCLSTYSLLSNLQEYSHQRASGVKRIRQFFLF